MHGTLLLERQSNETKSFNTALFSFVMKGLNISDGLACCIKTVERKTDELNLINLDLYEYAKNSLRSSKLDKSSIILSMTSEPPLFI